MDTEHSFAQAESTRERWEEEGNNKKIEFLSNDLLMLVAGRVI